MIALIIMDQSTEAIYKLCALIALLGLASPRDNIFTEVSFIASFHLFRLEKSGES